MIDLIFNLFVIQTREFTIKSLALMDVLPIPVSLSLSSALRRSEDTELPHILRELASLIDCTGQSTPRLRPMSTMIPKVMECDCMAHCIFMAE